MNAPMIVSVRDPRDAICSLMTRFGQNFAGALQSVAISANVLAGIEDAALVASLSRTAFRPRQKPCKPSLR